MEYGKWLQETLGHKVQKVSIDAGCSCPNRDGRVGTGGCTFCAAECFVPKYCRRGMSVGEQVEAGKRFFAHKYKGLKFLAYFQSYTSTYGELHRLKRLYEEALAAEDVVGIVVGTRPDCIAAPLLDYFEDLSRRTFLCVEYGLESLNDETLVRINRGHDVATSLRAVRETAARGIYVGAHIILGFPWESCDELLRQADLLAGLPIKTLKLHQLQVLRGTELARQYEAAPWPMPTPEQYVALALDYINRLPASVVIDRLASQCPPHAVLAPKWGLRSQDISELANRMGSIK